MEGVGVLMVGWCNEAGLQNATRTNQHLEQRAHPPFDSSTFSALSLSLSLESLARSLLICISDWDEPGPDVEVLPEHLCPHGCIFIMTLL